MRSMTIPMPASLEVLYPLTAITPDAESLSLLGVGSLTIALARRRRK